MERCPNCGAPARPNANFCTTCGVRLPDDLAPPQPAATETPPPAPASDNGWPPVDDRSEAAAEPAASDTGDSSSSEDQAEPEVVVAAASETVPVVEEAGEPSAATWPTAAAWPEWSAPVEAAAAIDVDVEEAETDVQAPGAEAAAPPQVVGSTAAAQALALLDELRALVPTAVAASPAPAANATLADELAAALAADDDDLAALRAAMERARERPKDIDTVLDLAGRVDAVIALLDAYDRLRAAAESTVAQLRAQ